MNLQMNLRDLNLWEKGQLKGFALPLGFLPEIGETVNILEPFKRLFIVEEIEKDGEIAEKKTTVGIVNRSDGMRVFDSNIVPPEKYSEASRWSPAAQLPDYAIRRRATITSFEWKPLRSFSENDIKLLHLDYDSQNDPQLIMKEYLSTKNFDLLYSWWKEHYKASLKNCDNPKAIILRLASSD